MFVNILSSERKYSNNKYEIENEDINIIFFLLNFAYFIEQIHNNINNEPYETHLFSSFINPFARPNQKKQGRELKNKARERFDRKSKYRRGRKPLKKHTPGRGDKKYI